jgi:multidrug resistance efflux pump
MHAGAITGRRGVIMPAKPLAAAAGTPPTPVPAAEVTVLPPEWAVAGTHLFREQALAAYMRGDREARMLRAEPAWTRSVVAAGAILALTVALLATFGRVDVTTEGVGILRAEGDLQFARAEIAGMVSEVHARSGDLVEAGQAIVTLESASLQAALLEADRRLQAARTAAVELDSRRLPLFAQRRANLEDGVRMLERRRDAERRGLGRKAVRARGQASLARAGWASRFDEQHAFEEVLDAKARNLGTAQQIEGAKAEIVALDLERDSEGRRVREEVGEALARRDAVQVALSQTTIRAAKAGTLDSVLVRRGDAVQVGAIIAKIVSGVAQQIIGFVPERDRAFLEPGAVARVELTQLPAAEFGVLRATVTRVAKGIASAAEIRDILGDQASLAGSVYRVDLALDQTARRDRLAPHIRAGSLVNLRYVLRQRSMASLVISPFLTN